MTAIDPRRLHGSAFDRLERASDVVQRAARALVAIDESIDPAEPLRFAIKRVAGAIEPVRAPIGSLLDFFDKRVPGNARSVIVTSSS
jgi:hypothetical protein